MANEDLANILAANVQALPVLEPGDVRRQVFTPRYKYPLKGEAPVDTSPVDAITRAAPVINAPVQPAATPPAPAASIAPVKTQPAPFKLPAIPDIKGEVVPEVSPVSTRSIEELQGIADILAPDVTAKPFTREQLIGGDVFGLSPAEVHNVTATKVAQLQTKAASDKAALDFLRTSTGTKTAEKLVTDKIQEEGAINRAKFAAESTAAEAAKARNRSILLEKYKLKVGLANRLLLARAKAAEEAAAPKNPQDLWKDRKASILYEYSKTNPLAAVGAVATLDPAEAQVKLEQDKLLPVDSPLRMSDEERNVHMQIVSLGLPPTQEEEF